jgi:hypothetical protein
MSSPLPSTRTAGTEHDFDFLFGKWRIEHRRLKARLQGSNHWDEFETTGVARPIWGGIANLDEIVGDSSSGALRGLTLRLFDPASRQWRLYWANADRGILDQPMIGGFKDGRGEFFDQELFEGEAIYVRYVWSDITPTSCRWEQAFSADGGRTWETNWTMEMSRIE